MNYKVNIWQHDSFKRSIVYSAENDIQAIQMASAATPDGCRSTYEEITMEEAQCLTEKEHTDQNVEDQAKAVV
tara:strand:- start:27 stop:245 length:219 start_codon:yes stop_codon:yes gene_type:complete